MDHQVIHHDRQYTLMTNDPTYDDQLKLLAAQDFSNPSREMPLPCNVNAGGPLPAGRLLLGAAAQADTEREAIAGVMATMPNVSVPFGAPYAEFGVYNTEYRTVTDLTNRMYFFELTTSPSIIWADFDRLKLEAATGPISVDP